jgi:predicted ATPase
VEDALNIYEVLGVGALRTRLQVSARRGLTRFVGRQSEMEQLQRALEHAKSLELRAVMSLVRLWQSQGKKTEAHQMLSDIYGWFTEGFETKDLQEAQAVLEELA